MSSDESSEQTSPTPGEQPTFVRVKELRDADDTNTCLRPLGLCDLGGCCDVCWYRPDHPRFKNKTG